MRHQQIRLSRAMIPNTVTMIGIFAGYLSILYTFEGYYVTAAWLIVIAGILDFFDGRLARMVGGTSKFGSHFDSLADAINYGVAPSLLFFKMYFIDWGFFGSVFSFLPTVFGTMRLARYNVLSEESGRSTFFLGLPTTVAAGFLASYIIFANDVFVNYGSRYLAAVLLFMASVLMVSEVRYEHNRAFTEKSLLKNWKAMLGILAIVSLILFPTKAFFGWLAFYVSFGLIRSVFVQFHRQGK